MTVVTGLEQRGHAMPVLLRIENLLDERITLLNKTFAAEIAECGYQGEYMGVFPIKVNQQCHLVEEITKFCAQYHHGLEAGSKAKLIIAMSHLRGSEACIVCNGYKNAEFVELVLHPRKLGLKCFFVIETASERAIITVSGRATVSCSSSFS
ncbi:MAG: arginine decarboxylase [Porticoccus sp.]|jgi:arginine decarboxylase